jgi:uncharacterized protein (DUF433 family)
VSGADGVMRVGGTRVTLDTILAAFSKGATAEEIAQQYPSVSLADVYQVIAYFLRHTSEVETYLTRRREEDLEVRRANEARWPPDGIRARLLARRR